MMENEVKKEKMKTSDKIITTILLLAIIVGGGYFACKHFGIIGGSTVAIEEPEGIETVEVWVNPHMGKDATNEGVFSAMENSPATYFTGDYKPEGEGAGFQNLSQMDKATFESKVTKATISQMTKGIAEDIEEDLNRDFTCSVDREYEEVEYAFQVYHIDFAVQMFLLYS